MPTKFRVASVTLSANASGTASIEVAEGKTFRIFKITPSSTGNYNVTAIKNTATGENFLSGTMDQDHFKGQGNGCLNFIEAPLEISGPAKLHFEVTDTSGSTNTVSFACIGEEA